MRGLHTVAIAAGALVSCTTAAVLPRTQTSPPSTTSVTSAKSTTTTIPTRKTGCAAVQATLAAGAARDETVTLLQASDALACLKSVPLDIKRSSEFCDYVRPYLQFQSTMAYLKNPPMGWTLPGVDLISGLAEIQKNVQAAKYASQFDFEVDLYTLVNILPHDFHSNLPMPLIGAFEFAPLTGPLISISEDGLQLPQLFFKNDWDQVETAIIAKKNLHWEPSNLLTINGLDATQYLNAIAQVSSPFQDPDAIYNQAFTSVAFRTFGGGNIFSTGAHLTGFAADSYNYTFANGTTRNIRNVAVTSLEFTDIESGQDLFDEVDLPPTPETTSSATATSPSSTATSTVSISTVSSLTGYPTPIIMHRDGFTSGYFLPDSKIAVLAIQSFADPTEKDEQGELLQQSTITSFLAKAKAANMKQLIVDVQANGGGNVFAGFDAFKQLFPTLDIFGASRIRATPAANYLGSLFSATGIYNESFNTIYQSQSSLDINNHPFASWSAEDPPVSIYGDNFTVALRENFTDPVEILQGGLNITGYGSHSKNVAPQLFTSDNIVLLYDGSCGSTCTIFSELMKTQGGVRSIALGGRPQNGPMQGVAGSKGAQVLTYADIASNVAFIPSALEILKSKNIPAPALPPAGSLPNITSPSPLGDTEKILAGGRFNLRNAMRLDDSTNMPLQYKYEAANCRLFYTLEDQYAIEGLWERVADVAWGKGKCVQGSTTMGDGSFPQGAFNTVAFGKAAYSKVVQKYSPGLIAQKTDF